MRRGDRASCPSTPSLNSLGGKRTFLTFRSSRVPKNLSLFFCQRLFASFIWVGVRIGGRVRVGVGQWRGSQSGAPQVTHVWQVPRAAGLARPSVMAPNPMSSRLSCTYPTCRGTHRPNPSVRLSPTALPLIHQEQPQRHQWPKTAAPQRTQGRGVPLPAPNVGLNATFS